MRSRRVEVDGEFVRVQGDRPQLAVLRWMQSTTEFAARREFTSYDAIARDVSRTV